MFEDVLDFKKMMITLNDADCINVFKSGGIKILSGLISFNAAFVYWYFHHTEIGLEVEQLELSATISSLLKYLVIFSFIMTSFPLVFLDCMITYTIKHLEYQIKILNVLVKQIPIGLGSNDTIFNEEIRERLNTCIGQNLNVRR